MHSKFFKNADLDLLQNAIDNFLKELNEVTGNVIDMKITQYHGELVVVIIYNCWKKI